MIPDFNALVAQATLLLATLRQNKMVLATAESCTGGLIAAILTEVPGSSDAFERGFVTYSNAAKTELLGVPPKLLAEHGAVSEETARAMAMGAISHSPAGIAFAVTGVAGPNGGSEAKPVGLVHLAAANRSGKVIHRELRLGDIGRSQIRRASVAAAFDLVRAVM
jgi:nicotinamide-nucleotide amidase